MSFPAASSPAPSTSARHSSPAPPRPPSRSGSCDLRVFKFRDPAADQVAVAVDAVDAGDGGPVLVLARPGSGKSGLLARVGVRPLLGRDGGRGVRRVLQRVVLAVELPRLDRADLLADRDERVAQ